MLSRVQISPPETKATHCNFFTPSPSNYCAIAGPETATFRLRLLPPSLLPAKTRSRQRREMSRAAPRVPPASAKEVAATLVPPPRFLPSLKTKSGGGGKLTTRDRSLLKVFLQGATESAQTEKQRASGEMHFSWEN